MRTHARAKGRSKGHSFLRLIHPVIESAEWRALSGSAVKLAIELGSQYRGSNNGDLSIEWAKLKSRGWKSQATVHAAKRELIDARFIVCTRQGGKNRCSLYAITWEPIDGCDGKHDWPPERVASHAWRKILATESVATPSPLLRNLEQRRLRPQPIATETVAVSPK